MIEFEIAIYVCFGCAYFITVVFRRQQSSNTINDTIVLRRDASGDETISVTVEIFIPDPRFGPMLRASSSRPCLDHLGHFGLSTLTAFMASVAQTLSARGAVHPSSIKCASKFQCCMSFLIPPDCSRTDKSRRSASWPLDLSGSIKTMPSGAFSDGIILCGLYAWGLITMLAHDGQISGVYQGSFAAHLLFNFNPAMPVFWHLRCISWKFIATIFIPLPVHIDCNWCSLRRPR